MAGKGSKQRPLGKNTTRKQFDDNWDRIFGKKQQQHQPNIPTEEEKRINKEQAQDPRNG